MPDMTDHEIAEVLARFVGGEPRGNQITLYNPFRNLQIFISLDSMSVIEAELQNRGWYANYLRERFLTEWDDGIRYEDPVHRLDRQPAVIRAKCAAAVIRAKEQA